jgi:hypothetical protein
MCSPFTRRRTSPITHQSNTSLPAAELPAEEDPVHPVATHPGHRWRGRRPDRHRAGRLERHRHDRHLQPRDGIVLHHVLRRQRSDGVHGGNNGLVEFYNLRGICHERQEDLRRNRRAGP